MTTRISGYQDADREACRALWVELTEWHRQIYDSPTIGGSDPGLQFDEHLERVGPDRIWVAARDDRIVGMAGMIQLDGEAELEPIVVSRDARRQGIGHELALAVIEAARESGARQLLTRPVARNEAAIRFFHVLGFDVVGQLELLLDFRPRAGRRWRAGERFAGRDFRV